MWKVPQLFRGAPKLAAQRRKGSRCRKSPECRRGAWRRALHLSISISASIKCGDNTYLAGKESMGQSQASATTDAAPRASAPYASSQARAPFKRIFSFF